MNVAATPQRIRSNARLQTGPTASAPGVTARQDVLQVGQLAIESIEINPARVLPGGTVTVVVNVRETAEFVGPGGALCSPTGPIGSGILAEVTVDPGWAAASTERSCIPITVVLEPGRHTFEIPITAPNTSGDFTVDIGLVPAGSGNDKEFVSRQITVAGEDEGGREGCRADADCGTGFVCDQGECVEESGGLPGLPLGGGFFEQLTVLLGVGTVAIIAAGLLL